MASGGKDLGAVGGGDSRGRRKRGRVDSDVDNDDELDGAARGTLHSRKRGRMGKDPADDAYADELEDEDTEPEEDEDQDDEDQDAAAPRATQTRKTRGRTFEGRGPKKPKLKIARDNVLIEEMHTYK